MSISTRIDPRTDVHTGDQTFIVDSRRSTNKRDFTIAAVSSSRVKGTLDPMALMCVPGASQAPDSTGVCELVATTTTSAPRTASSADAAARIPNCRAKDAAFRGLHTRTSRNVRTRRSASRSSPRTCAASASRGPCT